MKQFFLVAATVAITSISFAQQDDKTTVSPAFNVTRTIPATPVKNQAATGTCWSFSTTSLIESQALKVNQEQQDISEMFTVYHMYIEKAKNYVLRQGHAQFGEGGLGHDVIRSMATYGAVPEEVFTGLKAGKKEHNHQRLAERMKNYLDSILKIRPVPANWMAGVTNILEDEIGTPGSGFEYKGKKMTAKEYAANILRFDPNDYVNITSFTHHPYYRSFVLEVPDNWSNGEYYNLPLNEMIQVTKDALAGGYSVMWDADVSNNGFMQRMGVAVSMDKDSSGTPSERIRDKGSYMASGAVPEVRYTPELRQQLFEDLTTQDDHLMHITGLEKAANGATFFLVKNSWGEVGPAKGYIHVSEPYFAINTISLVIPKAALKKELLAKLDVKNTNYMGATTETPMSQKARTPIKPVEKTKQKN